jgi:hypothetical protein
VTTSVTDTTIGGRAVTFSTPAKGFQATAYVYRPGVHHMVLVPIRRRRRPSRRGPHEPAVAVARARAAVPAGVTSLARASWGRGRRVARRRLWVVVTTATRPRATAGLPTPIQVTAAPVDARHRTHLAHGQAQRLARPATSPTAARRRAPRRARPGPRGFAPVEFEGCPTGRAFVTDAVAARRAPPSSHFRLHRGLGLTPHDLSQAAGQPADRSKGYQLIAYRFQGATEPDMLPAFLAALIDAGVAETTGSTELGGRRVRTLTSNAFAGPLKGAIQYMYQDGDTIYGAIAVDEAVAARLLEVLP